MPFSSTRPSSPIDEVVERIAELVEATAVNRTDAIWAVGRATIGTATKLVAPLRVYGAERVPLEGGLVVAANHFSWIDPPALGAAIPRTLYFMAKVEAHRVPGLGQLMRSFGAFSVRRGESDRDAVRTMREIVRDGHALGLFVEGTRQRSGVPGPVQPGAAMVAINEDVPVICAAIYGSYEWRLGNFKPGLGRVGHADDVRRAPARRQGLQGGVGRDRARDQEALGVARGRPRARPAARRDAAVMTDVAADVEIAGTVAIVGFPNVGKSTLINRLTATRTAVVHETPGVTRDRKELLCEWSGTTFRLIDTGGVDRADTGPFGPQIAAQAREAVEEADLVLFVVDAKAGVTPGDEELAEILRASRRPVLVLANKLDDPRRDLEALEFHRLGLGDPIPISALHGHGSGDLLDEIVEPAARARRAPGRGGGDQGRDPRPPERRQVVAPERAPRARARHRLRGARARRATRSTRCSGATTRRSSSSTRPGLRRKRKQRQGIEYYSELRALEAAERADVALVLVDASQGIVDQDLAVADVARKAQCATIVVLSKWDVTEIRLEDVRPEILTRLRQRPPLIAISAHTGRGLERLLALVETVFAPLRGQDHDRRAQPRAAGAPRGAPAARPPRPASQPPLRDAGELAPAALPVLRQRPQPRHARLRLLGRERAARALRARGRARLHRLRDVRMRIVVVGAGSWGTAFACLLRDNGHEVTLAARDPAQAEAMNATGRNPRYAQAADLAGIVATPIADAPVADAELVVVAVPSRVFGEVVSQLPGDAPVLSLTKGLDPATGAAALDARSRTVRSPSSPGRTSPTRSFADFRQPPWSRATTSSSPCASRSRSTRSSSACT